MRRPSTAMVVLSALLAAAALLSIRLLWGWRDMPSWDGQVILAIGWDSLQNEVLVFEGERRPYFAGASFVMREPFAASEVQERAEGVGVPEPSFGQYSYEAYDTLLVLALAALRADSDRPSDVVGAIRGVFDPADGPSCGPRGELPLSACVARAEGGGPVGFVGFSSALRDGRDGALTHTPILTGTFADDGSMALRERPIPSPPRTFCPVADLAGPGAGDGVLRFASGVPADALRSDPVVTSAQVAAQLDLVEAGFPWPVEMVGFELGAPGPSLGERAVSAAADALTVATVHWVAESDVASMAGSGVLLSMPLISGYEGPLCGGSGTTVAWHDEVNLAVEALRLASERGGSRVFVVLGNDSISDAWRQSIRRSASGFDLEVVGELVLTQDRYAAGMSLDDDIRTVVSARPDVVVLGGMWVPEFESWGAGLLAARR